MKEINRASREKTLIKNSKITKLIEPPYTILMLIDDIKKDLETVINSKITDKILSRLLSDNGNLITYIKKNFARNPRFQISIQELSSYVLSLKTKLKEKSFNSNFFIEKYKRLNDPKKGANRIYNFHPNINLCYFKYVNTKEKAYWLGFIFADGGISYKEGRKVYYNRNLRLRFGLKANDIDSVNAVDLLAQNIGIESKYVNIKSNGLYGIEITSDILVNHLVSHGLLIGKEKTYKIELPALSSREFLLAFLLGFFDGDGKKGSTRITSSSYKFLDQIRRKFKLPYTIYHEPGANAYSLHLGAVLFNEMLDNYKRSMPKKRVRFITPKQLREKNTKLKITPEVLKQIQILVLRFPIKQLSSYFGISAGHLGEICRENHILKPRRGYWRRKEKIGISPLFLEGIKNYY